MAFQQFLEVCSQRQLAHDSPLNFHLIVGFLYILITTGKYPNTSHAMLMKHGQGEEVNHEATGVHYKPLLCLIPLLGALGTYTHVYSVYTPVTPTHTPARHNEACRPLLSYWADRK